MGTVKYININNVSDCLTKFSEELNNQKYAVKIEYKTWRKLSKATEILFCFDAKNGVNVSGFVNHELIDTWSFSINDNGFGQYLFDTYYNKEVYDVTSITTNSLDGKLNDIAIRYYQDKGITTNPEQLFYTSSSTTNNEEKNKENTMNTNKMFNFDFGFITDGSVRFSLYGPATKNQNGTFVAYDENTGNIVDVEPVNFNVDKMFMKMPVAIDDIQVGNLIIHNRKPCYVVGFVEETGNPMVIDIYNGTRVEILPTTNMFHFNFYTKIVSLMDSFAIEKPSESNPFGNMWMFMLMNDENKMDGILPFLMMNGSENVDVFKNPMMMYLFMKGKKDFDPMMMLMLMKK